MAGFAGIEQGNLLLALGTIALLNQDRCWRIDFHRLAFGAALAFHFAHFFAFGAQGTGTAPFGGFCAGTADSGNGRKHGRTDGIHDRKPGQAGS